MEVDHAQTAHAVRSVPVIQDAVMLHDLTPMSGLRSTQS